MPAIETLQPTQTPNGGTSDTTPTPKNSVATLRGLNGGALSGPQPSPNSDESQKPWSARNGSLLAGLVLVIGAAVQLWLVL